MKVTFDNAYSAFQVIAPKGTMISYTATPTALADGVYVIGNEGSICIDDQLTDTLYLSTVGSDYTVTDGSRVIYPLGDTSVIIRGNISTIPFKSGAKGGGSGGGCNYKGTTTTAIENGSTTNPITIDGEEYTAVFGDIVVYGYTEFVFDGTQWSEFGRPFDTTPTSGSANAVTSNGIWTRFNNIYTSLISQGANNTSVKLGNQGVSAASYTLTFGYASQAKALGAIALGEGTYIDSAYGVAIGKHNASKNNARFLVGNGVNNNRSNILEVTTTDMNINGDIKKNNVSLPTPYTTMPTITAEMLGQIAQYVGTTDGGFTQGYFYIASSDGAAEPTYSWVHLPTQNGYSETVLYTNALENNPETSILLSDSYTNYDNLCVCLGKKGSYWFSPYTVCKSLMSNGAAFGLSDEVGYVNAVLTDATHITIQSAASGYGVYKVIGINYGSNGGAVANPVRSLAKSEEEAPTEEEVSETPIVEEDMR